jgi:hypothetical protein
MHRNAVRQAVPRGLLWSQPRSDLVIAARRPADMIGKLVDNAAVGVAPEQDVLGVWGVAARNAARLRPSWVAMNAVTRGGEASRQRSLDPVGDTGSRGPCVRNGRLAPGRTYMSESRFDPHEIGVEAYRIFTRW